ncbi:50S ribosomal protein L11 methyltransferase [Seleniivibrio woodruffii]|uniref:50S ribosomal protein L11 methyltransferase n=1 Tax=Seleniivibrio woodruffii TaxID=1078050 RepID=UPI001047CFC8|nr:50S ribosomal protein L11 methyltransferase [Seleniivibrio woodruffii]TVZ36199.1 [LSU ribosomal protein L11P]-lysine N-methyltransferase [Seleniivibrio woodruffii]
MERRIHEIPLKNGRTARIYQGAFGSGEHETTKACIAHLERMELSGKKMLDVGCGTGILGICASLLGAGSVVGYDVSFDACATAKLCNELNDIDNNHIVCGFETCIKGTFDIIFANIYYDILTAISDFIYGSLAENGLLVLSGVPVEEHYDIRRHYMKYGLEVLDLQIHEDYCTVLFSKGRLAH